MRGENEIWRYFRTGDKENCSVTCRLLIKPDPESMTPVPSPNNNDGVAGEKANRTDWLTHFVIRSERFIRLDPVSQRKRNVLVDVPIYSVLFFPVTHTYTSRPTLKSQRIIVMVGNQLYTSEGCYP